MAKYNLEKIKLYTEDQGWQVLSEEYVNLDTTMRFLCPEGHQVELSWKRMRGKFECPVCNLNILTKTENKIIPKPKGVKRILALDQAGHTSGWAIFDGSKLVRYGSFTTNDAGKEIDRFSELKTWLISMINGWQPDFIALEGIQLQAESQGNRMGVTVFQSLARLQGILMETCYFFKVPFEVCPTNTWRHFCGVKGKTRSDRKRSMRELAKQWYGVEASEDEADAIGIGKYFTSQFITDNWEF